MLKTKADYERTGTKEDFEQLLENRFIYDLSQAENGRLKEDPNAKIFRLGYTVDEIVNRGIPAEIEGELVTYSCGYEGIPDIYGYVSDAVITEYNEKAITANKEQAKVTRDLAYDKPIKVFDVYWQVEEKDRDLITSAIDYAKRQGKPDDFTRHWKLLDNAYYDATAAELEAVLDARTERIDRIWLQYETWLNGDNLSPFVFNDTLGELE